MISNYKLLLFILAIGFGIFLIVFGEYDDSPGGMLLGAVIAGLGAVAIFKSFIKNDTKIIDEILTFWFEETKPEQRFKKDAAFDAQIKKRFEKVYWDVLHGKTKSWRKTPEGRLAEIIVLDQFARNIFRDDKQAFAGDEFALDLARKALAVGADKKVAEERRTFFYMPFMHSESRDVHEEALEIFKQHGKEENLKYEIKHKTIIDRFGRYPHRNEVLGRESTEEEKEFLKDNPGF